MKWIVSSIFSLLSIVNLYAMDFTQFQNELESPFAYKSSQNILLYGTGLTIGALALRHPYIQQFEEHQFNNKPLHKWSQAGDLVGQLIPNLSYSLYNFGQRNKLGDQRAWGMIKATTYASLVTTTLKYSVRAPRPGDSKMRNSFPSGHATTIFAFSGYIIEEHGTFPGIISLALGAFCGYSRIQDRMHRVHEVIAGGAIGLSYGIAMAKKQHGLDNSETTLQWAPILDNKNYGLAITKSW